MKRLIALFLTAVLLLSVCMGCTPKTEAPTTPATDPTQPTNPPATPKTTLRVQIPLTPVPPGGDNALTKWLEAECNVELIFEQNYGKTYDIVIMDQQWYGSLDSLDLSGYFADREGASKIFWDRLEENFSEAEIRSVMDQIQSPVDGSISSVPTIVASPLNQMEYQMWINKAWLDELKLDKPHDLDSLYAVLKAFKARDPNCVPLHGSEKGGQGADVISWLINFFIYYDKSKHFNVDDNGQLYLPYTTEQYREALKFIKKLVDEGLLLDSAFSTLTLNLVSTNTPSDGVAKVGIFAGNLDMHVQKGNEVLCEYEALPLMENVVFRPNTVRRNVYITKNCQNPDKAFEILMKLWSQEGANYLCYGAYGVDWTEPDEGAVSAMGLPCTVKMLRDRRNPSWGVIESTLNANNSGETIQYANATQSKWEAHKNALCAQSIKYHNQAAAANNPKNLLPVLRLTMSESGDYERYTTDFANYFTKARVSFCKGDEGFDLYDDNDWNDYKTEYETQLNNWLAMAQKAYNRQMGVTP